MQAAANDNEQPSYSERWPLYEEYIAKRLGNTTEKNELVWEAALYIADTWDRLGESIEYFPPGCFQKIGEGGSPTLGDMSIPRGQEVAAHALSVWRDVDAFTNGRFWTIVKPAVVDQAEMRDFAPDAPKTKRAAVGRERLIDALLHAAEAVRILDLARAA